MRLSDQPHTAFDADVGISFDRHVKNFQAVVIETRHLALEGAAVVSFPAADLDDHLAVEDGELAACGRTPLLRHNKTYSRLKRQTMEGWKIITPEEKTDYSGIGRCFYHRRYEGKLMKHK